jgi:hypothetical protein
VFEPNQLTRDPRRSVPDHLSQTFCPAFLSRFFCPTLLSHCETFCPAFLSRPLYVDQLFYRHLAINKFIGFCVRMRCRLSSIHRHRSKNVKSLVCVYVFSRKIKYKGKSFHLLNIIISLILYMLYNYRLRYEYLWHF